MKFSEYNITPELKKNLDKLGFKRPTDIQFKSIPYILKGEDVLAIAQTGTGKTAAYGIPIIHKLQKWKAKARRKDGIKCLVMVPTHELAIQVTEVLQQLGKHTMVRTICIFGGVDQDPQIALLDKGADILVTTPGRMFDLRSQGYLDLHRVETLILDEADHMLAKGFIKDIKDVLHYLPKRRQTLFFSATIDKDIKRLAYSLIQSNAIRIQIAPKNPVAKNVYHKVGFIEMDDKRYFLERLYREYKKTKILVFVRTKVRAERLFNAMKRVSIDSITIHGDKSQKERNHAMEQFKSGAIRLLIATDVSARGVDIPNVDYVVNYDLPEQAENYVHRVGRTGRGNNKGNAISFCSEQEKELLADIEFYIGGKIEVVNINKLDYADTLDFSKDTKGLNWKALIAEELKKIEEEEKLYGKKPSKKKKKR
ncbi:DEAD/DEAH box helicase [Aureispira anguillae]|uniref:DEAD/DEAH box helicase n=1 Tax=Aureispira anguillae TaxID=2864201 RepID=A0A915YGL2_9BACT|nr:DEAD/DEAH box helicase [Aureispira anguillae]BDS12667.1 DEAD/DEAH box helicase [Aureispira anguillae]